jgi:uncharacterized protein YfdQ (DUF2303 family)
MSDDSKRTVGDADAIIEAMRSASPLHSMSLGADTNGVPRAVMIVKQGHDVFDMKPFLDKYLVRPERRKGTATFTTLASFIHHANRFKDEDSAIFCNDSQSSPGLTSVLDYHQRTAKGLPQFGEHRGHYSFPLSDEWKAWKAKNGVVMGQTDFARFLEDRVVDVADAARERPDGSAWTWATKLGQKFASAAELLELSKGLHATVKHEVRNEGNLSTGEKAIFFAKSNLDPNGQPLAIASAFLIGIPVFKLGPLYPIPVRLRHKIDEKVTWSFELARLDAVFEDAIDGACSEAASATALPLFRGSPE